MEEAGDMGITLHRAFDVCRDPYEAMEQCISLGIDTILTSGQKSSAWEGRDLIKDLVKKSAGRIEILAGAGINPESIAKLAPYTNAKAYHMSGKVVIDSRMEFRREGVPQWGFRDSVNLRSGRLRQRTSVKQCRYCRNFRKSQISLTNKGEWDKISIVYETGKEENK